MLRTEKRLVERVFWNEEAGRERRGRPLMLAAAQLIKMVGVPSYWIISMVFSYRTIPHRVCNDRRKYRSWNKENTSFSIWSTVDSTIARSPTSQQ